MAKDDKTLDVLKRPVHAVVLKPQHLQELRKRGKLLLDGGVVRQPPPPQKLPRPEKPKKYNPLARFDMKSVTQPARDAMLRTKLTVLHDHIPPLPAELQPPCDECKTSACCRAFVVGITKEEYESGYYAPYAIELDPEYMRQIQGKLLLPVTVMSPVHSIKDKTEYYLEGRVGEVCPFLKDNRCSIYDVRPITCRVYSCVEDGRITQEMRAGITDVFSKLLSEVESILKNEEDE